MQTYMHVQRLAIAFAPANCRCHDDKLVFGDKIAYAALLGRGFMAGMRLDVEFEGRDEREQEC